MNESKRRHSKTAMPSAPFGTLVGKMAYSQMVHIKNDDLLFFKSIDTNEEDDEKIRASMMESFMSSKSVVEEEPEEICNIAYCRKVKLKIKDVKKNNAEEKVRLKERAEKDLAALKIAEKAFNKAETRYRVAKEKYDVVYKVSCDMKEATNSLERESEELSNEKSDIENKMMVLEADQQFLLRAIADAEKAIRTAIYASAKSNNQKLQSLSARSKTGITPRVSTMRITHNTIKTPLTAISSDNNSSVNGQSSSGKYDQKQLAEYKKEMDRINFPVIEYKPLASTSVLDYTEIKPVVSASSKKYNPNSSSVTLDELYMFSHTYNTDPLGNSMRRKSANSDLLNSSIEMRLKNSDFYTSNSFYNSHSFHDTSKILPSLKYRNKSNLAQSSSGKKSSEKKKQVDHNNPNEDDSSDDENEKKLNKTEDEDKGLDLSSIPKLNPLYHKTKTLTLFGRDHEVGKILSKPNKKKSSNVFSKVDFDNNDDNENEDDNEDVEYIHENDAKQKIYLKNKHGPQNDELSSLGESINSVNQYSEKIIDDNRDLNFVMNNEMLRKDRSSSAKKYHKKHFSKVLTIQHPGLTDKLIRKYSAHAINPTADD